MRQIDTTGIVYEREVAFYFDCDEGLHLLPLHETHKFTDKVFDPFPERKNGRFGATVILGTTQRPIEDVTLEQRARAKAKHLIGLKKQELALAKRQQVKEQSHDTGRATASSDTQDRPGLEQPTGTTIPAEAGDRIGNGEAIIRSISDFIRLIG